MLEIGIIANQVITPPAPKILDTVGQSATMGYSVNLLSNSYTGACMRVRRSSDNAEANIGFLRGSLNVGELKQFIGSSSGFVRTWFNQAGAQNLSQATTSRQPKIADSGNIYFVNGSPFIRFYGTAGSGTYNSLDLGFDQSVNGSINTVMMFPSTGFILSDASTYFYHHNNSGTSIIGTTSNSSSVKNGIGYLNGVLKSPAVNTINTPKTSLGQVCLEPTTPNSQTGWDNIGRDRTSHHINGGGGYSEIIIFPTALDSGDRTLMNAYQLSKYNI